VLIGTGRDREVVASHYRGKELNSPNDVVVHPDGGMWFTDPGYGSMMNYEGHKGDLLLKEAIYRIEVVDFPAFILIDDKGNDFFSSLL